MGQRFVVRAEVFAEVRLGRLVELAPGVGTGATDP
jgi:hypothetical protein